VTLFTQRALAVKPDFEITAANASAVVEICTRLDGLPLAIELAAARVKLLPPQALLTRLGRRLDALEAGSHDLPARQQTLRGAIAWSHDLLDADAQRLFARFSIFVGGAELEAAETVCGDAALDVLAGLAGLVDQSLIRQEETDGEPRFAMLFTIREFALERLVESDESATVAERHAAVYRDLAEASAPGLTGKDQKLLLDRLSRENGNLRAALTWSIENEMAETALRLGAALWRFWQMRGMLREGAEWLERVLAIPDAAAHPRERAKALEAAGGVAHWRGELETSLKYYEACLELCRTIGDRAEVANALYNVGFPTLVSRIDVPRSRVAFEECLAIARELGDKEMTARVLWGLGNANYFASEYEAARDILLEDVAIFRTMDDPFGLAWALHTLGLAYNKLGATLTHAVPLWREALEHFAAVGDVSGITILLADYGLAAVAEGDLLRAVRLDAASERMASAGGTGLGNITRKFEETYPDVATLDPAEVQAAVDAGLQMTIDESVEYALRGATALAATPVVAPGGKR
jgi:predicted ATPase